MSTFGEQARVAVLWNTGFGLFREFLQFGLTLILVRLVAPEAYGQFGLVTSIIGFLQVFSFDHFIAYTLQVRNDDEVHYQDHFTAGAVFQIGMFVLTNAVALALRGVQPYAAITPILHIMSVVWLLDWPSALRIKMLERALDWKRLRVLHAIGLLGGAVLAVSLAAAGAGLYALCLSGFVKRLVFLSDLFVSARWRPTWAWSAPTYVPAWRFGLTRVGSTLLVSVRKLLESGVCVHLVGFAGFGIYGRAVGLAHLTCYKLAVLLMQSVYPVLTKIEPDSETYRRASALALRSVAWVVIPLGSIGGILATPIIHALYGEAWSEVIPLMSWAMIAGVAGALTHAAYMLALASQHKQGCLLVDLWMLFGTGAALLWLLPHGMQAYIMGLCLLQLAALLFLCSRLCALTLSVTMLTHTVAWPLGAMIGAWCLCEGMRYGVGVALHNGWTVCLYSVGFGVVYIGVMRALCTTQFDELASYLPGRGRWGWLFTWGT
ncbi:MAG: oligosaccharide flippase family protein [Candidatus Tectomicrobia bacterium]|nr:oligosaccharide flippase family protein [Candidatus Tectomicrobia bacterium]